VLHLSILIEQMRREGYEFCVGKPEVIRKQIDGRWQEPFESLASSMCPTTEVGPVMELIGARRGQIKEMRSGRGEPDAPRVPDPGPRADRPTDPVAQRHTRTGGDPSSV
jgi:predicted membrane GTPase involved in stress response